MIINRIYEAQNLLSLWLVSFLVGLRTCQHPCSYVYCIPNICPPSKTRLEQSIEINVNRIELHSFISKRTTLVTFIAVRISNVRIVRHTDCEFKDTPISHKLRKYANLLHAKQFLSLTYLNPITKVTVKWSLATPGRRRAGQKHSSTHSRHQLEASGQMSSPLNNRLCRPQNPSGSFGEQKTLLPPPNRLARSDLQTTLPRLLIPITLTLIFTHLLHGAESSLTS